MSIENIAQAKAAISETAAYKTLAAFFDNGEFTPIANLAKSKDTYAEVVAGRGFVDERPVYAFAQNPDFCGGEACTNHSFAFSISAFLGRFG